MTPVEIELKLALPTADPAGLRRRLAALKALGRPSARQQLHNVYYDTPDQALRRQRIALRLRQVDRGDAPPQWLQTLKIGAATDSALSRRGEWESAVPGAALAWAPLAGTPWAQLDPDGALWRSLAPCFSTRFERTRWLLRPAEGCTIEVALDLGEIKAGGTHAPICELEFELLSGSVAALFALARQIAAKLGTLPLAASKAERGYALAEGRLAQPVRAAPPPLQAALPLDEAAGRVLREGLAQFIANLYALYRADDPELAHQARVGWRRFRSAGRLFRPALAQEGPPDWQALQPLLDALGALRDLDVARTETLPALALAYACGDGAREATWAALLQSLTQAADAQRQALRDALQTPAVGAALLAATEWLQSPPLAPGLQDAPLRPWVRRRLRRLHRQLREALQSADDEAGQHRARILAKRLRYDIEALAPLLPRRARDWQHQAVQLQTRLGASRDLQQAALLVAALGTAPGPAEFLRGVVAGRST